MPDSSLPISLCMIVRDEAESLARCLESARPWVSELVVVDTGSTDATVAIAERAGARVLHFAWCDDFAAARNVALEAATCPWALVLDADERLEVRDPAEWQRLIAQREIAGVSLACLSATDDGQVSQAMVFRLFRRDLPDMRYRGQIHEQVVAVAEGRVQTAVFAGSVIHHDGYRAEVIRRKDKAARNLTLARKLVASRPDDPQAWAALGMSATQDAETVKAYERALALWDGGGRSDTDDSWLAHLYLNLALAHLRQGHQEPARAVVAKGLARFAHAPDLRFVQGQLAAQAGEWSEASAAFEACLSPEAQAFPLRLDPAAVGYGAHTALAKAQLANGRPEEAMRHLVEAIRTAPAGADAHEMLGVLRFESGDWNGALPLLRGVLERREDHKLRFRTGWCAYKLARHAEALALLAPLPDEPNVLQLRGQILLDSGKAAEALAALQASGLPSAGLAIGWAHYVLQAPEKAAEAWQQWLRAGAADWGTKDALATFLFMLQGGSRPDSRPERPAEPLNHMTAWLRLLLDYQRFDEIEAIVKRAALLGDHWWRPLRKRIGALLVERGFSDAGLALLLAAREAEPSDAEIYYYLGLGALAQQKPADARVMWQACLTFAPEHALARQALSLL